MDSFETRKKETIKKEIKETENQKAAFKVKDKRSGQDYEIVLDKSGNRQTLNREKEVNELENEIKKVEKQSIAEKLSRDKSDLIKEIKELENEFKQPGIKSKKTLIEKSILEKEAKVREIENQLGATKKKKEDEKEKKEELPEQTMKKEGERKQIEYQGESLEEKKKKIEKLWLEVEKNRKEYLEKDYKNNKVTTRLKGFFGSFFKKDKEGAGYESDKDLAEYRAHYDNSLLEHKKAVLDEVRLRGASGKELLDIAKIYQVEANVNLADVHDQVKIENQEGKFSGFIKEHSKELVERYKKMPLAKKIAIGAAFGLAGAGAIYIGGAAVGIAGSAIAARRAIMGVITGTTVALSFEARGKKKTAKKNQKEMSGLEKKMAGMSEEEKIKILEGFIDESIQDEDRKINKIKNKNLRHLAYGTIAGIGVVLAPKITRLFSEAGDQGSSVLEHQGGQNILDGKPLTSEIPEVSEIPEMPEAPDLEEQIPRAAMPLPEEAELRGTETGPEIEQTVSESAVEETEIPGTESVIIEVQKGDNLWKIIDKQMENQESYAGLDKARKIYVIDALKDKVAADPGKFGLENIDKLKIGQKINLSELFQEEQPEKLITGVRDLNEEQVRNIMENNEKLRGWINTNPGEELTSEKTEEILKEIKEVKEIKETPAVPETSVEGNVETEEPEIKFEPETNEAEEISEKPESAGSSVDKQVEGNIETEEPRIEFEPDKAEEPEIKFEPETSKVEPIVESSSYIENASSEFNFEKDLLNMNLEEAVNNLGKNIIGSDAITEGKIMNSQKYWNVLKNFKCQDVLKGKIPITPEIKFRLARLAVNFKEDLGTAGLPRTNETINTWLKRISLAKISIGNISSQLAA